MLGAEYMYTGLFKSAVGCGWRNIRQVRAQPGTAKGSPYMGVVFFDKT